MATQQCRLIEDPSDFLAPQMYVYADETTENTPWVLSSIARDIAHLWRHRFIDENSIVFANALHPRLGMWILNSNGSAYTRVIRPRSAGWVRLSNTHCRWGAIQRLTGEGTAEISLASNETPGIELSAQQNVIVAHDDAKPVAIIYNGQQYRGAAGVFSTPAFKLIDLPAFEPPATSKVNPAHIADAWVNGVRLLTYRLNRTSALRVRDNVMAFKFDDLANACVMHVYNAQNSNTVIESALPPFLETIAKAQIHLPYAVETD